jgi:excisionase family DNA binding protein
MTARECPSCGGETGLYEDLEPVYSVIALARLLDVDSDRIYKEVKLGRLGAVRLGKLIRIPRHQVIRFLTSLDPAEPDGGGGPRGSRLPVPPRPLSGRSGWF